MNNWIRGLWVPLLSAWWVARLGEEANRLRVKQREYMRRWTQEHPGKVAAWSHAWKQRNPERCRGHRRKYCEQNREKVAARIRKWQKEHPEKVREWRRRQYADNPEIVRAAGRRRYARNPEHARLAAERWNKLHPEKRKEADRLRRLGNPELYRERERRWKEAHPEKVKAAKERRRLKYLASRTPEQIECARQRAALRLLTPEEKRARVRDMQKIRRKTPNAPARLRRQIDKRVSHALKRKSKKAAKTEELLGCTIQQLREHLESLFLGGMSWDTRDLWHIDHIRPCNSFDLTDPAQQRECFHFTNLQPLWAYDNAAKHDRWG